MDIQVDFCFLWVLIHALQRSHGKCYDEFPRVISETVCSETMTTQPNRTGGEKRPSFGGKFWPNSGIGLGRSLDQTLVTCRKKLQADGCWCWCLWMDEFCQPWFLNTWKPWWWQLKCFYMCSPRKIGGRWTHLWRMFFQMGYQSPFWVQTDDLEKDLSWFSSLPSIVQSVFGAFLSRCHEQLQTTTINDVMCFGFLFFANLRNCLEALPFPAFFLYLGSIERNERSHDVVRQSDWREVVCSKASKGLENEDTNEPLNKSIRQYMVKIR